MVTMSASFDRWLEHSLANELAAAYEIEGVPARARYRQPRQRGNGMPRSMRALALLAVGAAIAGAVGAEAAGYGPVHVGTSGLYVRIGTPATPNPPVVLPTPTPALITRPTTQPAATPDREDTYGRSSPSSTGRPSASESPEHESSGSPQGSASPAPSGSPRDE